MLDRNSIDRQSVKELQDAVRDVIDILETMDDATYNAVDDFVNSDNAGRYTDMLEWLQHIMSVR